MTSFRGVGEEQSKIKVIFEYLLLSQVVRTGKRLIGCRMRRCGPGRLCLHGDVREAICFNSVRGVCNRDGKNRMC